MKHQHWQDAIHKDEVHSPAIYESIFSYCVRTLSNAQASVLFTKEKLAEIEQKIARRNKMHVIQQVSIVIYVMLAGTVLAMITAAIEQYLLTAASVVAIVSVIAISIWWSSPFLEHQEMTAQHKRARAKLARVRVSPFDSTSHDVYSRAVEILLSCSASLDELCDAWQVRSHKADKVFMEHYFELVDLLREVNFDDQSDSVEKHRIRLQLQDVAHQAIDALYLK